MGPGLAMTLAWVLAWALVQLCCLWCRCGPLLGLRHRHGLDLDSGFGSGATMGFGLNTSVGKRFDKDASESMGFGLNIIGSIGLDSVSMHIVWNSGLDADLDADLNVDADLDLVKGLHLKSFSSQS